jgi:hypothetical protein
MNRYDKFFSELTLVSFTGGAMGSFLINFLLAEHEEYYRLLSDRGVFRLKHNQEWQVTHYFQNIRDVDISTLTKLSNYYGKSTFTQQALYAHAHIVQDLFLARELHSETVLRRFTFENVLRLVKKDFDKIIFPYVKNHQLKTNLGFDCNNKSINYKKRIYCTFPSNKSWIGGVFSVYKHNLYKLFDKNHDYEYGLRDVNEFIHLYLLDSEMKNNYPETIPEHESLDIYELVFNKNFDGLKAIYPNYEPNDLQLELLDSAHNSSIEVLNKLNLSHDIVTDTFSGTKDFLNQTGLIKLLYESLELEKKKQ